MEKILVVGANGTTGKQIVDLLKSSNVFEPVAMVRKEEQTKQFKNQGIKTIIGDLEQEVGYTSKGIDKIIFAAGSGGKKVEAVDQEGAKKMIDAGKEANIKKFVMLSSVGADDPSDSSELKEYLEAKHNADEYLKNSGVSFVIVRPGTLNNENSKGKIELSKSLYNHGEITRADVAKTLVNSLQDNIKNDSIFEIIQGSTPINEALKSIK